jgi:hypothetical protein
VKFLIASISPHSNPEESALSTSLIGFDHSIEISLAEIARVSRPPVVPRGHNFAKRKGGPQNVVQLVSERDKDGGSDPRLRPDQEPPERLGRAIQDKKIRVTIAWNLLAFHALEALPKGKTFDVEYYRHNILTALVSLRQEETCYSCRECKGPSDSKVYRPLCRKRSGTRHTRALFV